MSVRQEARSVGVAVDHENREKDDFYPTPPEGIEALLSVERFVGPIWEPACGDGAISRVLEAQGHQVVSTDLVDRGYGEPRVDFLMEWQSRAPNIVTNPPFKFVAPFMRQALSLSTGKVAFLLRLACLEGAERRQIFESTPLARVWVFSRRLQIWRNGDATSAASGMIPFAWFIWDREHDGPPSLGWLPSNGPVLAMTNAPSRRQQVIDAGITGHPWHEIAHELGISEKWAAECFRQHASEAAKQTRASAARTRLYRPARDQRMILPGPAVPRPIAPEPSLSDDYFRDDPAAELDHGWPEQQRQLERYRVVATRSPNPSSMEWVR